MSTRSLRWAWGCSFLSWVVSNFSTSIGGWTWPSPQAVSKSKDKGTKDMAKNIGPWVWNQKGGHFSPFSGSWSLHVLAMCVSGEASSSKHGPSPMEPTEPENRKADLGEQDSPPKTQEIEVSTGWDEHWESIERGIRVTWVSLLFPFFAWLLPSLLHRNLPARDPAFLWHQIPSKGPEFVFVFL